MLEEIIPLVVPFILGLFSGVVIKRAVKLVIAIIALIIALIATGYLSTGFKEVRERALEILPKLLGQARDEVQLLPYSSASFLIGLGIGMWKG